MSRSALCLLFAGLLSPPSVVVRAQLPRAADFRPAAFQDFVGSMFGEETAEERAALQKIPVPISDERQHGNAAADQFIEQLKQREIRVLDRGKDVSYLRCLANRLWPLMQNRKRYPRIRVLLADSDNTDAISFPGGTIIVFRGLIDFCESEAALVGILGHELSHIDRGHQLYYIRRFRQAQQTFTAGGSFDPRRMMSMSRTMARAFARPFRPEEESEADRDGARWAFRLGYASDEMARVFQRLHERDKASGKTTAMRFFRSHPYHIDRYKQILQESERLQKSNPDRQLRVGRDNLAKRQCARK